MRRWWGCSCGRNEGCVTALLRQNCWIIKAEIRLWLRLPVWYDTVTGWTSRNGTGRVIFMGGCMPAGAWLLPGLLFSFLRGAVVCAPYALRLLPDAPSHHNLIPPHSARSNHAAGSVCQKTPGLIRGRSPLCLIRLWRHVRQNGWKPRGFRTLRILPPGSECERQNP